MNPIMEKFLREILKKDWVWDWKTGDLIYPAVVEELDLLRQTRFMHDRWFPLMFRAIHLCKVLTCLPSESFNLIKLDGDEVEWFSEEWLTNRFAGPFSDGHSYLSGMWYGMWDWAENWDFYYPPLEEILSLGIQKKMVRGKKVRGVFQESLF